MNISAVFVAVGLLFGHVAMLATAQVFITTPRDSEILLGKTVVIACRIFNEPGVNVYWSVPGANGKTIGPNKMMSAGVPNRFSVIGSDGSGEFNLVVRDIRVEDDGEYVCMARKGTDDDTTETRTAKLRVIQILTTGQPACWVEGGRVVNVGDAILLKCGSSDPTLSLTWYIGDSTVTGTPLDISPRGIGIQAASLAESQLNGRKFTCQSDSESHGACQVTIEVRYAPVVSIESIDLIETGKDAVFKCNAQGNPSNFAYVWHYGSYQVNYQENPRFNRARLEESGSRLVLPDLTENDDSVILRCEAVNMIGSSVEEYTISARLGRTLAQSIGPILLGIILGLVLIVLVLYIIWWRRQKRKVQEISKMNKDRNPQVQSVPAAADTGVVYTHTLGGFGSRYGKKASSVNGDLPRTAMDLESVGYGPDVSDSPGYAATDTPEDDGALRPIPRKRSSNSISSMVAHNRAPSTTADDTELLSSPDCDDAYTYHVNPHFGAHRMGAGKDSPENEVDPDDVISMTTPTFKIESEDDPVPTPPEEFRSSYDDDDNNFIISTEL